MKKSKETILEICCGDIDSVAAAVEGGADRIELCSALDEGGLTPSRGLIRQAVKCAGNVPVNVLIRPRGGDFLYTQAETEIMLADIDTARQEGASGVVIGALNPDGSIDTDTCKRLVDEAHGLTVTFHRAFDMCRNPLEALETIISLGCDTLLTSGCAATAPDGCEMLSRLTAASNGRIAILGGSGVNPSNASTLMEQAHLCQLHASARSRSESLMTHRHSGVSMGSPDSDEYSRLTTDKNIVHNLAKILHRP